VWPAPFVSVGKGWKSAALYQTGKSIATKEIRRITNIQSTANDELMMNRLNDKLWMMKERK
jgi:hypothetical protein